ncbi:hypothetical protein [Serinicoccus sp. LYQ131]|uniref:hypothetical protein n=1 Tax=Serinicoccus sp. LYQ131 TaxID=3378797 RepID=UPI00385439CE
MSLPRLTLRPPLALLTALLAAFALMLASLVAAPAVSAMEDDAAQTAEPAPVEEAPQALPAEDFVVDYVGPECWDSSYNVYVEYAGDDTDLRLVLQEQVDGTWVTLSTQRFYDGSAAVWSDWLEEGETGTFQVLVYDRTSAAEQTLLHGPVTVTGVSTEGCDEFEFPTLPEEEWTLAEADCGSVTFTSRTDEEVVVLWTSTDAEVFEEDYFFLAPGESHTVETTYAAVYWVSATGLDEDLEPIAGEIVLAGEGEVEVEQDCAVPTEPEPTEPTQPEPGQPGDDEHTIPGKVQTDGGANTATMGLGLGLLSLAGLALVRRTV